jgi:hypothetical protein
VVSPTGRYATAGGLSCSGPPVSVRRSGNTFTVLYTPHRFWLCTAVIPPAVARVILALTGCGSSRPRVHCLPACRRVFLNPPACLVGQAFAGRTRTSPWQGMHRIDFGYAQPSLTADEAGAHMKRASDPSPSIPGHWLSWLPLLKPPSHRLSPWGGGWAFHRFDGRCHDHARNRCRSRWRLLHHDDRVVPRTVENSGLAKQRSGLSVVALISLAVPRRASRWRSFGRNRAPL